MTKSLPDRLRAAYRPEFTGNPVPLLDEAARALDAMTAEVERVSTKLTVEMGMGIMNKALAERAEAEVTRLRGVVEAAKIVAEGTAVEAGSTPIRMGMLRNRLAALAGEGE